MSLERCCCVFATKKLGLTPLKAIAPIAIAYGIFIKRKNTSRVGGYLRSGGHAFGLRRTKFSVTEWPQLVETWLHAAFWR
jgi:hypothetical protein